MSFCLNAFRGIFAVYRLKEVGGTLQIANGSHILERELIAPEAVISG
jgi:hypothetical protein